MILEVLPKPSNINTDFWVDEAIWGHRLHDEQNPWLTFLEFLGILQSEAEAGRPFIEAEYNHLEYYSYNRLHLRNILFNNPYLEAVNSEFSTEEERWEKWLKYITNKCGGLDNPDFSYLRERFSKFGDFVEVVKFLQFNAIERDSNKRWTSKFVFPYGVNCLYQDLDTKGIKNDRRFFARTGELLYLMVSRSNKKSEIAEHLTNLGIIDNAYSSKWNKLVGVLQPDTDSSPERRQKSSNPPYLPYKHLKEFDDLAEDWLNLFNCHLPDYDCLPHLVTITGLHLVIYFLKRAKSILDSEELPTFVMEIIAPRKTIIRDLASDSFLNNNNLSVQAVEHYIRRLSQLSKWQECLNSSNYIENVLQIIKEEIYYKQDQDIDINAISPDKLLEEICEECINRHKKHIGKFHNSWMKEIGMASSRGSRRTRYAPTDSLLKTLVLCCVPQRREFQDFLEVIYQKYGIIIGEKQAISIISNAEADQEDFAHNSERLEQRLASLGLLKRLSDACAYIVNPYTVEKA